MQAVQKARAAKAMAAAAPESEAAVTVRGEAGPSEGAGAPLAGAAAPGTLQPLAAPAVPASGQPSEEQVDADQATQHALSEGANILAPLGDVAMASRFTSLNLELEEVFSQELNMREPVETVPGLLDANNADANIALSAIARIQERTAGAQQLGRSMLEMRALGYILQVRRHV